MYTFKKYHSWSIYSSSEEFLTSLRQTIEDELGISCNVYTNTISISKKQDLIKLENYLYKDANVFLKRKRDKILEAIL